MQTQNAIETINLTKTFKSKRPNPENGAWLFNRKNNRSSNSRRQPQPYNKKRRTLRASWDQTAQEKPRWSKCSAPCFRPTAEPPLVNGYDIIKEQMQVKRSLGTLFSVGERGFFWRLNGYRNLEFFAAIYNVPRQKRHERIMEVLKLVGLENSAYDLYQKYSGGMKRKLRLARTLLA